LPILYEALTQTLHTPTNQGNCKCDVYFIGPILANHGVDITTSKQLSVHKICYFKTVRKSVGRSDGEQWRFWVGAGIL